MITEPVDRIEEEIAIEKSALRRNLDELEHRAKDVVNWRSQVQRHPMGMMALAAGAAFLVGAALRAPRGASMRSIGGGLGTAGRSLGAAAAAVAPMAAGMMRRTRSRGKKRSNGNGLLGRRKFDRRMTDQHRFLGDRSSEQLPA
ncbi:MAG: hypothetical protein ACYC0B_00280 [Gemmatimonadaceae bacterium]